MSYKGAPYYGPSNHTTRVHRPFGYVQPHSPHPSLQGGGPLTILAVVKGLITQYRILITQFRVLISLLAVVKGLITEYRILKTQFRVLISLLITRGGGALLVV